MPVSFEIDAKRGIVVVEYSGRAGLDETFEVFGQYAMHPKAASGQVHMMDLSRVTEVEQDFPKFMKFQAQAAEGFGKPVQPSLMVFYCPNPPARQMAEMVRKSWDGLDGLTLAIIEDEAEALAVAGCTEKSFAELKQTVAER